MKGFCPACGIKTEGNVKLSKADGSRYLTCDCGYNMRFYILSPKSKTDAEVEDLFQDTPLTDSQRGTKKRQRTSNVTDPFLAHDY